MKKESAIYLAGHRGLVGSVVYSHLINCGYTNIITRDSKELDLRNQSQTNSFFSIHKPEYVILAAAKVGGILANASAKAQFIYDNIMIASNVIHAAYQFGVKKLINLGSSCIYPKEAPQPIKEEYLLTGLLEITNDAYAIAKISALKMCMAYNEQYGTNFISAMPTNLYGSNDNFDLESSHVLPAMIRKFHEASTNDGPVILWGDGSPLREFLYSEDLADALVFMMENIDSKDMPQGFMNVGTGMDLSIRELSEIIQKHIGYTGRVIWDRSKPNGTMRKVLDITQIQKIGWNAKTSLSEGIRLSYESYLENQDKIHPG